MAYSPPTMFRSIQVTDSLKLADTDVLPTLLGLQTGLGNLGTNDITLKNVTCTSLASSGTVSCGVSPTALGHLTPKAYVDGISYLQAGAGLSKNFSSLSVNAAQPGITSVGTLTSLSTGAITGTSATFSSAISVGTPTATGHATNKSYVDGIGYITAGAGLTKTSGTLSVNPTQTQITSVGTLGSLTVSGAISSGTLNASSTTDSADVGSGAIVTAGGLGVQKNVFIGGSMWVNGPVSPATPTQAAHATTKAYVDALGYLTAGTGLTKSAGTLSVNPTQSQITSVGTLGSLNVSGDSTMAQVVTSKIKAYGGLNQIIVGNSAIAGGESSIAFLANTNGTFGTGVQTGWAVGNGVGNMGQGNFSIYGTGLPGNAFSIQYADNSIKHHSSTDSSSPTTGGTQILGGLGVAKNVNVGGTLNVTGNAGFSSSLLSIAGGTTEAYTLNSSSKGLYIPAGTVFTLASGYNNVDGATLMYIQTNNASNGSCGVFLGAVGGISNGAGNFVIGRRTGATSWAESLRVDTNGTLVLSSGLSATSGTFSALSLTGAISATSGNFTGAVSTSAVPSSANHLTNKSYVDNAITTANAQVSTGTFTTGTFTVSGLTFNGLTKSVRWSKVGAAVIVSAEFTWTSTTGTLTEADGNTTITTPFNSPIVRSMNVVIQKDSFVTTKMSYMDEASPALKTRVNAADMPGYATGATLLFSWTFYT